MRFDRLHILRYGALSDCDLQFRADARLHLVFGPNEAGKSSVLAAISDLLFGFPKSKQQDFRHEASSLRIGANVRAKDGTVLSFRRRRGNKNTILSGDDQETALHEDALAPFLGSLSREVFDRAFGLDSARLRAGAHEMLRSEGELGSILFAAASGLVGLSKLRSDLEAEADRIFAPRASKERVFYQILARHEEARRAERQGELRASDWKALLAAIDDLRGEMDERRARRVTTRKALARLQMLRQLQPLIGEIDRTRATLEAFADLSGIPDGLAADLSISLADAAGANDAVRSAQRQVKEAGEALALIHVDEPLAHGAEKVHALVRQTGDYVSKQRDLPRIEAERDEYLGQIADLTRRLGLPETAEIEPLQPSDATLVNLRELITDGRGLAESIKHLQHRIDDEKDALASVEREQRAVQLVDPKSWRERLAALDPDLQAIARRRELETSHAAGVHRMREEAGRLVPAVGDMDRLAAAPLPSTEAVAVFRDRLETLDRTVTSARDRLAGAVSEIDTLAAEIAQFERDGAAPTREAIADARHKRDSRFAALADVLLGNVPALAPEDAKERIEHLRLLVADADRQADLALADAESVSRHATNMSRRTELEQSKSKIEAEIFNLESERGTILAAHRALFDRLEIEPGAPTKMIGWIEAVSRLLEDRHAQHLLAAEIETLEGLAAQVRPALESIANGIVLHGTDSLPVSSLARLIGERLDSLADIWTTSRAAAARREDAVHRIGKLEADLALAIAQRQAWAVRFLSAVQQTGLPADATIEQADAAHQLWERLPAIVRERDNRARRVAGMYRDIAAFDTGMADLVGMLAPDMYGLPSVTAIEQLREKVDHARTEGTRRAEVAEALGKHERHLMAAQDRSETAAAAFARLTADLPEHADSAVLAARLAERDSLTSELAASRARFVQLAEEQDEDDVRAALAGFDREQAAIDAETLANDETALIEEMNALAANLAENERERERLEAGSGAERAAFEKNAAEAEIVEVARQWAVLRIASSMLGGAMERHRESQADPLMRRSGALFSTMTGGSFSSLDQDYGEDDRHRLMGVRASGERVSIEGMSDGTRDQLYLALRLAFLEDYAERNEPVPFIGDDIFQTFDDERSAAGILAISEAGRYCQPILFTHHRSVVTTAKDVLGDALDLLEF